MMKKAIIVIIFVVLFFFACDKSVVIDRPPIRGLVDTVEYVPRKKASDTTQVGDTARVPISFDVSVDNWGNEDVTEI